MTTTSSRVQRGPTYRPAPPRETNYIGKHRASGIVLLASGAPVRVIEGVDFANRAAS